MINIFTEMEEKPHLNNERSTRPEVISGCIIYEPTLCTLATAIGNTVVRKFIIERESHSAVARHVC